MVGTVTPKASSSTNFSLWLPSQESARQFTSSNETQEGLSVSQNSPTMKAVLVREPGAPEVMSIGDAELPKLSSRQVLINVRATALNRADTLQRKGLYPPPPGASEILGLEAAGVIEELGSGCALGFSKGDKIMALLSGGGYAEYCACDERHIMRIPTSLSFNEAAAIPEVWLTAYQLLFFVGKVEAGESVLLHAGSSGVGQAALQLCKNAGITAYVTVGSEAKQQKALSLGAVRAFNYKTEDWVKLLNEETEGKGVNAVLDPVGASYWEGNMDVLAADGRWVLYGLMGGARVEGPLLAKVLRKRINLIGTTLRARSDEYKETLIQAFSKDVLPKFEDGSYSPNIDSVFPISNVVDAHKLMESNQNAGKIILEVQK